MIRTISQNLVLCLGFAQEERSARFGKELLRFDRVTTPEIRSMKEDQYRFWRETRQVISYRRLKAPSGSQRGVRLSFPGGRLHNLAFPISLALIK
jgi:hypothetical protein